MAFEDRAKLNIICKHRFESEWIESRFPEINILDFLANYQNDSELFGLNRSLHQEFKYKLVFLNNNNTQEIQSRIAMLEQLYPASLFDFGSGARYGYQKDVNVFLEAKFSLFLKSGGYICNSVVRSIIAGVPVLMIKKLYDSEYAHHFPSSLFILADDYPSLVDIAFGLSEKEYSVLSSHNYYYARVALEKHKKSNIEYLRNFVTKLAGNRSKQKDNMNTSKFLFYDFLNRRGLQDGIALSNQNTGDFAYDAAVKNLVFITHPQNKWVVINYAIWLSRVGYANDAIKILSEYDADDPDILANRIDIMLLIGEIHSARCLLDAAIASYPAHQWLNAMKVKIYENLI